ncbi:hypothetical protein [Aromatoleum diolicum]|uniref:hypothetical protein n=1 Tax=Aromatoleum diolicum TaxID=75796 RepID=UPI001FE3A76D|nr:hypothetical protein [Aromatoleum diolicum]
MIAPLLRTGLRTLAALALLACTGLAVAADLGPLLERIVQAYGTAAPPTSILQRGRTISHMQGEGALLRAYRGAERFRIEIHYPNGIETRIVDGPIAWQRNRPMGQAFRSALILQAARIALPWNLLAARDTLRDRGEYAFGDGRLHLVELPLADGLRLVAEVDPASGRVMRSRGILPSPHGGEMVFGTIYDDFRSVDGRLYPAIEHHYAMGRYIGRSIIDTVEFDAPIADALFRPEIPGLI